ncbi:ATP-binding protein [Streptomyces sp. NPDC127074]|uniref:ATP-binding protein n=1 Tax=Streptomyces sp. NPDC127074 TaxID=3347130 RepID=UPI00365DA897
MRVYSQSFFLVRDPASVRLSRRRLHDLAENWGLHLNEASGTALTTVLSELVTNAVRHGTGAMLTIGVRANLSRQRILFEVYDGSRILPAPRCAAPEDETGRGMALIDRLSVCHGAERTTCGKCVWAEIALPAQRLTRRQLILRPGRAARAVARRLTAPRRPPRPVSEGHRARHGRHPSPQLPSTLHPVERAWQQHPPHISSREGESPCTTI